MVLLFYYRFMLRLGKKSRKRTKRIGHSEPLSLKFETHYLTNNISLNETIAKKLFYAEKKRACVIYFPKNVSDVRSCSPALMLASLVKMHFSSREMLNV